MNAEFAMEMAHRALDAMGSLTLEKFSISAEFVMEMEALAKMNSTAKTEPAAPAFKEWAPPT